MRTHAEHHPIPCPPTHKKKKKREEGRRRGRCREITDPMEEGRGKGSANSADGSSPPLQTSEDRAQRVALTLEYLLQYLFCV